MWCLDWDGSRRTTSTWATPSCQTLKTCSAVVGQVDVAEPSPVLCGVDAKPVLCGVEASPVLVAIRIDTRPEKSAYELLRDENIREREAMFESLNIEQEVASCREGMSRVVEGVKVQKGKL